MDWIQQYRYRGPFSFFFQMVAKNPVVGSWLSENTKEYFGVVDLSQKTQLFCTTRTWCYYKTGTGRYWVEFKKNPQGCRIFQVSRKEVEYARP
jgi:hypothetical protein